MKKIFEIIFCSVIFLVGCAKNFNEFAYHNESMEASKNVSTINNGTLEEGTNIFPNSEFPPKEEKDAPIKIIPRSAWEDTEDEEFYHGRDPFPRFEFESVKYICDIELQLWDILMDEDGNILVESSDGLVSPGEYDSDNDVIQALRVLDTLEYVGFNSDVGHIFRYGDKLLVYYNFPQGMQYSAILRDSYYDPNQYYNVKMYTPW